MLHKSKKDWDSSNNRGLFLVSRIEAKGGANTPSTPPLN